MGEIMGASVVKHPLFPSEKTEITELFSVNAAIVDTVAVLVELFSVISKIITISPPYSSAQ